MIRKVFLALTLDFGTSIYKINYRFLKYSNGLTSGYQKIDQLPEFTRNFMNVFVSNASCNCLLTHEADTEQWRPQAIFVGTSWPLIGYHATPAGGEWVATSGMTTRLKIIKRFKVLEKESFFNSSNIVLVRQIFFLEEFWKSEHIFQNLWRF